LTGLIGVIVDRLFAQQDQIRIFLFCHGKKHVCRRQRFYGSVRLHQNCTVGTHGQRGAQLLLGVGDPDAYRDDFDVRAALLDAQRLFERDFVKRVDAHFYPVEHDAAAVGLDPNPHVVINDALDAHHDLLHESSLKRCSRNRLGAGLGLLLQKN
jgi:hypothetical protein